MKATIDTIWGQVTVDLKDPIDLSLPVDPGKGPKAWYVSSPRMEPVRAHGFLGSVAEGGNVNFRDVAFNPHGNGTHTECLGHITRAVHSVYALLEPGFCTALLISVAPDTLRSSDRYRQEGDLVITRQMVEQACVGLKAEAIIIRTLPNLVDKRTMDYSSANPPYLMPEAVAWIRDAGFLHLILDLPSVDREKDEGELAGHHIFWQVPDAPNFSRTITELVFIPDEVPDGRYLLDLQVAPFQNDASPSRPLLFKLLNNI